MAVAVALEVRAAQRRIVSTINASGRLNADGLALWRETVPARLLLQQGDARGEGSAHSA
ncbi:hypothetical protein SGPA1_40707 [Streptomyces misionensis JCM 4497]